MADSRLSISALCARDEEAKDKDKDPFAVADTSSSSSYTPLSTYSSSATRSSADDDDECMSFTSGLSIDDPDVRLAAEALEDLRCDHSDSPTVHSPSVTSPSPSSPAASQLFSRMSNYTLVSSAVRVYESGKSYSRGFKYGAEIVESVARPVVRRFEPLEGFALRQLDRLERKSVSSNEKTNDIPTAEESTEFIPQEYWQQQQNQPQQQQASLLHNVITNASGLTVAMSDESLKSLRYCLQWLKYANGHLEKAVTTLNTIVAEQQNDAACTDPSNPETQEQQRRRRRSLFNVRVTETKADIVSTIRKVVGVVSTYAGSALPEPARSHVRTYVLELPARWATASASIPPSRRGSAGSSVSPEEESAEEQAQQATEQASRVIILASEALQMLGGVTHIVGDTLDRAEGWCDRFGRRQGEAQFNESSLMEVDKQENDGDNVMQD
ncbi:transcription factor Opi1-domain-containing protein [Myxozyma melibiosi]|uniref:Transcription factor Opi1-domain-containing protein n=1 Tax=Myxozyma melibiosi TaxID=54550 RepID=A0ABR1F997_9ASCO